MPGGRLTYEDRRHIATGLAGGLPFAEIARRLARPTSTVSREVQRNGGAAGYRAERADRATRLRGRRTPAATPRPPLVTGAYGRDPAAVRDLQESLTALILRTGLSRMPARVLACLCTVDSGSLTAAELVRRLGVSPASISKAVGQLAAQELIRRERDPHGRRDRYVLDDQLWLRAWLASARMNEALADATTGGAEVLGEGTPAGARMTEMSSFLRAVGRDMVRAAERWRGDRAI